jgi:hypothetical protein
MNLKVEIRRNSDGKVASKVWRDWVFTQFWWEEGNARCDCNRELFFRSANGDDAVELETECSDGKYSVRLSDTETGEVLYNEFDEP